MHINLFFAHQLLNYIFDWPTDTANTCENEIGCLRKVYAIYNYISWFFYRFISFSLVSVGGSIYGNSSTLGYPLVPIATFLGPSSGPVCVLHVPTSILKKAPRRPQHWWEGVLKSNFYCTIVLPIDTEKHYTGTVAIHSWIE